MKSLNFLLNNISDVETEIQKGNFDQGENSLVRIHYSGNDVEFAQAIAKEVKTQLPMTQIIGLSVTGVIHDGKIYDQGILISIIQFENKVIEKTYFSSTDAGTIEVANQIIDEVAEDSKSFAFLFFAGNRVDVSQAVREMLDKSVNNSIIGGRAGCIDEKGDEASFLFDEERVIEEGAVLVTIKSDYVLAYANSIVGHDPISSTFKITKVGGDYSVGGNFLLEIENKNSVEWIREKLGTENLLEGSYSVDTVADDLLLRFPFVLEGRDGASRFVKYNKEENALELYLSSLREGHEFKLGYLSPLKSVQEWQEVCGDLQSISAEYIGCYSCAFRKIYLENLSEWEMKAFEKTNISGAFLMGEIGVRDGRSQYLHGSCSVFSFAQEEKYLELDIDVFDTVTELQNSNINFISERMGLDYKEDEETGNQIFDLMIEQEKKIQKIVLPEKDNMTRFLKEQAQKRIDKICVVSLSSYIESSNTSISEAYNVFLKTRNDVENYLKSQNSEVELSFYNYDDRNFFFTAEESVSEAEFISLTQAAYKESNREKQTTFVVTISGVKVHELVERADNKNTNSEKYIVADMSSKNIELIQNEFELVGELNSIIKNKLVFPYFQGIYDNAKGDFYAFEALMRLQTTEGRILFPNNFMEIAKKYNVYNALSFEMVSKVLDIFRDRTEIITINVSALDITSDEFNAMVREKLSKTNKPERFIFELVETEQYSYQSEVKAFINMIKSFGGKIAIDDFGAGYSNFIEIGDLDIDLIKISGSLTSLLGTDARYDQILDSIKYLSKKMQVNLVAEAVETVAMQKKIISAGIRYSQGFFFSKPMPLEELDTISSEKQNDYVGEKIQNEKENYNLLFAHDKLAKKQMKLLKFGAPIALALIFALVFLFSSFTQSRVEQLTEEFLVEIATDNADKIATVVKDSKDTLLVSTEISVMGGSSKEEILESLSSLEDDLFFDKIFVSFDGKTLMDSNGQETDIDINENEENETFSHENVEILPITTNKATGEKMVLLELNFLIEGKEKIFVYGAFALDELQKVFDVQNFGGEAFYHLTEIDGEALIISGDNNNLFKDGDVYDFVDTLEITNGHTTDSIRKSMEKRETVYMEYEIAGESRAAVMTTVPGTDWLVVSVVLDEVVVGMVEQISIGAIIFVIIMLLVIFIYFYLTVTMLRKNQKRLVEALESSYFLSNSLQATMETDGLTRTYTRSTAIEKITEIIERNKENNLIHAMVILDVDNFKFINDNYGHNAGDLYLQELVRVTKSCLRTGDVIGRLGGDEFIMLLYNIEGKENAKSIVDRILNSVNEIKLTGVPTDKTSLSAGIAMVPEHGDDYETLNHNADRALYVAKNTGKNVYKIYNE